MTSTLVFLLTSSFYMGSVLYAHWLGFNMGLNASRKLQPPGDAGEPRGSGGS